MSAYRVRRIHFEKAQYETSDGGSGGGSPGAFNRVSVMGGQHHQEDHCDKLTSQAVDKKTRL